MPRRSRGKPKSRFMDVVEEEIKVVCVRMTEDRVKRRKLKRKDYLYSQ